MQQSRGFVTVVTLGFATSGQRKVTRQTINKVLSPTLRILSEFTASLIQIKELVSSSKCVDCGVKIEKHQRI
jgi:hypothetical protein